MPIVNNLVDRVYLYSAAAITAHFYDRATGKDLAPRHGTTWLIEGARGLYFVTNRHILDGGPESKLDRIEASGHFQEADRPTAETVSWTYAHQHPEVYLHPDSDTDLAVVRVSFYSNISGDPSIDAPVRWSEDGVWRPLQRGTEWLASDAELCLLQPGEQIFIAGYPGAVGVAGGGRSATKDDRPIIVSGIIASDPRYPATFGDAHLNNAVLCHSFSWGGMSGAPVFAFSEAIGSTKVVGINAGHIAIQGPSGGVISHFVRSSSLIDLLADLGEVPPQSGARDAQQDPPPDLHISLNNLTWRAETEEELNEGD